MTELLAFFDESGDLGWRLDAPYRAGGSSRYLVIAAALGEGNLHRRLGKAIDQLWTHQGWTSKHEKKWNNISDGAKLQFAKLAVDFCNQNPQDKLTVHVLRKSDVAAHMRRDHHLLYAHITTQMIASDLAYSTKAAVCPDELNAGAGKANLLQHLMRHEVWFRKGCNPEINQVSARASFSRALEFCDMLAGAAANHFEDSKSEPWNIVSKFVTLRQGL